MAYGETYEQFVGKFKPKKTTDDCYTPAVVYDAVADWVAEEYGVNRQRFVRPFYPGGDYENYAYNAGDIVVDNPPFSILSKICGFYQDNGIPFFLFAPSKTIFSLRRAQKIICGVDITYDNGAVVGTSFVTNMDSFEVRSAPKLYVKVETANNTNLQASKKHLPKYQYPPEVLTFSVIEKLTKLGVDFRVAAEDCYFVRKLDDQSASKKSIYGGGYLLSAAKAQEVAKAKERAKQEVTQIWTLSDRERHIVDGLGKEARL